MTSKQVEADGIKLQGVKLDSDHSSTLTLLCNNYRA